MQGMMGFLQRITRTHAAWPYKANDIHDILWFVYFWGVSALESSSPSTSKSCCVASRSARYTTEAPHKDKRVIPAAFLKFAELRTAFRQSIDPSTHKYTTKTTLRDARDCCELKLLNSNR